MPEEDHWRGFEQSIARGWGSDLVHEIALELKRGWQLKTAFAEMRQDRIAKATERITWAHNNALGELDMRVDADVYHYWDKNNPGCWRDKKFRDEFKRDNPNVRVTNRHKKASITIPATAAYKMERETN